MYDTQLVHCQQVAPPSPPSCGEEAVDRRLQLDAFAHVGGRPEAHCVDALQDQFSAAETAVGV